MNLDSGVHKRTGMNEETEDNGSEEKMSSSRENIKPNQTGLIWKTHLNVIMYSCCFWIQLGVLPYLSKKLGANPVVFGYLQTTFAVVQLCGGPLFGRFGDIFGSRAALLLAFGSAATAYFLLGIASTVSMLFLSRLPSVFMHAMQGSQMIATDVTGHNDRADALGKLGISYGIGMVIGPTVGGWITKKSGEQSAAFVSLFFSIVSIILVLLWIPKNTKSRHTGDTQPKEGIFNLQKIWELLKIPQVAFLLGIRIITGIPFGIFQSMFPVVSMEYFKLEPQQNGLILSYAGGLSIFVQGFIVGPLSRRFSEVLLLKSAICIIALSNGLLFMVTNIYQFCFVLIPVVLGGGILNVVSTAVITQAVPAEDTGAVLGIAMASNSFVRSVSPFFGGIMFEHYGWHSFGALGFIVDILVAFFLFVKLKDSFLQQERVSIQTN